MYHSLLPARSAAGSALALRTESFRRFLAASEGRHVEWAWKQGLLREYSAWAVALGAADTWQRAMSASSVPPAEVTTGPLLLWSMGPRFHAGFTPPSSSAAAVAGLRRRWRRVLRRRRRRWWRRQLRILVARSVQRPAADRADAQLARQAVDRRVQHVAVDGGGHVEHRHELPPVADVGDDRGEGRDGRAGRDVAEQAELTDDRPRAEHGDLDAVAVADRDLTVGDDRELPGRRAALDQDLAGGQQDGGQQRADPGQLEPAAAGEQGELGDVRDAGGSTPVHADRSSDPAPEPVVLDGVASITPGGDGRPHESTGDLARGIGQGRRTNADWLAVPSSVPSCDHRWAMPCP